MVRRKLLKNIDKCDENVQRGHNTCNKYRDVLMSGIVYAFMEKDWKCDLTNMWSTSAQSDKIGVFGGI